MKYVALFFNVIVPLLILAMIAFAFWDVMRRPSQQFRSAARSKGFWRNVLIAIAVLLVVFIWGPLWVPFETILNFAGMIAVVYYLGPERQRMGKPWIDGTPRGDNRNRGW